MHHKTGGTYCSSGLTGRIVFFDYYGNFMQSMAAFVAQNYGASEIGRAKKSLRYSVILSTALGVVMFVVTFWHGNLLASVFSKDELVRENNMILVFSGTGNSKYIADALADRLSDTVRNSSSSNGIRLYSI